jgi:pimeloyl-ACP methyl ester carboxylesterase
MSMMRWMGLEDTPESEFAGPLLNVIWLGGSHFRMSPATRRVMGSVFSDEELRGLGMPVLLLLGEDEVVSDPTKAMSRAERLVPDLETVMIPGGRHAMSVSRSEQINARMVEFLGVHEGQHRQ